MNLRAYQQRAIADTRAAIARGSRAPLLVLPTGGGKTIIFSVIAQSAAAKGNRVLILVHRRELIHQASSKLSWIGLEHGIIAAGVPALDAPVQIASVQTLARRLPRIDWQPALIIIDEAHHATAGQWERTLQHWPAAYRLGVTATPCRLDGRGLRSAFDHLVLGPSMADLITAGYLTSARIYAPPVVADLSGIRTRAGDYANDQAAAAMDRPTVTGDAIAHYQRLAAGQQAIAFCCNVNHAISVCDAFKTAGISAALLLGGTGDRDQVVANFAAGIVRVLVTVDVVSEGFDVPAASCAILLRPTKSLGLYLQQVGRVLRPAPGKQAALILDHVGNVTRHGFPDDHRDWTLDEGIRRTAGTAAPSVRTCPECFAAFKPAPQCPVCGANCESKVERTLRQIDGDLQELKRKTHQFRVGMKVRYTFQPPIGRHAGPYIVEAVEHIPNEPNIIGLIDRAGEYHLESANLLCSWISASMHGRRDQGRARTLPQLLALAKERGYSPGWAYRIYHARGQR